jgi:hypothetical protein
MLAALVLALPQAGAHGATPDPGAADERVRFAWSTLTRAEKEELATALRAAIAARDDRRTRLARAQIEAQGEVPIGAAGTHPWFDPRVHAPAQPIPRSVLPVGDDERVKAEARVFGEDGDPLPAWSYDWVTGGLLKGPDADGPEGLFACALRGTTPEVERARALALRALIGDEKQAVLSAFGHAYTDRLGNVYPTITLYEAWGSGMLLEMPDVDALGIVHTVLDDWRTWVAPIDPTQHKPLYREIEELYKEAREFREPRVAIAHCFVGTAPTTPDGFADSYERMHGLWLQADEGPQALALRLPAGREEFWKVFDGFAMELWGDAERFAAARARQQELEACGPATRALLED